MSQARVNRTAARPTFESKLNSWLEGGRRRLYAYRPRFGDWHFWMVQGLVIAIAVMHSVVEAPGLLRDPAVPYFIPTTLFLVLLCTKTL